MDYRHIKVEPMTPVVGTMASDALWQYHALFFRGQFLPPEAQSRLGNLFGEVTPHEFMRPLEDHPDVHITDHEGDGPSGNAHWHTDCDLSQAAQSGDHIAARRAAKIER